MHKFPEGLPKYPKIRPVNSTLIKYKGHNYLKLGDPMSMSDQSILIPEHLAYVIQVCDGTKDIVEMKNLMSHNHGLDLSIDTITELLRSLNEVLLIENGGFKQVKEKMLKEYIDSDYRTPYHAGAVYPSDPSELTDLLNEYCRAIGREECRVNVTGDLAGIISPHIDYARGQRTYAQLWKTAWTDLREIELVIVLGTDHYGGPGQITSTFQDYATPLGILSTEISAVQTLEKEMGKEFLFREEFHHIKEHSLELALVWLHYSLKISRLPSIPIVPILCGSFSTFISAEKNLYRDKKINTLIHCLKRIMEERKTLVISAGDLAHLGPVFGDSAPMDEESRIKLKKADYKSLDAICNSNPKEFFEISQRESDYRKICGLSPIYIALELLTGAVGEHLGCKQCPASNQGDSIVSIAGVLLYK